MTDMWLSRARTFWANGRRGVTCTWHGKSSAHVRLQNGSCLVMGDFCGYRKIPLVLVLLWELGVLSVFGELTSYSEVLSTKGFCL